MSVFYVNGKTHRFYTLAKQAVCGYIRNVETSLLLESKHEIQIPMDVINLCSQYYYKPFTEIQNELLYSQLSDLSEIEQIRLCEAQCDFYAHNDENNSRIIPKLYANDMNVLLQKTQKILNIICDYPKRHIFDEPSFEDILQTVTANLCRNFQFQNDTDTIEITDPNTLFDRRESNKRSQIKVPRSIENEWHYLCKIYVLFWRTVAQQYAPIDMIIKHIKGQVLRDLVSIFHSKWQFERTYLLKTIRIMYIKCRSMKPWVIELITVFSSYLDKMIAISNDGSANANVHGISEILHLTSTMVLGTEVLIKIEWNTFFAKCLSLLQIEQLHDFCSELSQCIVNFIHTSPNECFVSLQAIIEYWPSDVNHKNEYIFIQFVNTVIERICKNVQRGRMSFAAFAESSDLCDLIIARLCKCLLKLPDNEHTMCIALHVLSRPEVRKFIANVVPCHIRKIVMILEKLKKQMYRSNLPNKVKDIRGIHGIKVCYVQMESML